MPKRFALTFWPCDIIWSKKENSAASGFRDPMSLLVHDSALYTVFSQKNVLHILGAGPQQPAGGKIHCTTPPGAAHLE